MRGKKVAVHTLGCKVNQYESAALEGMFRERGYQVVDFSDAADVYLINTCTVTHLGDRKSRQLIRRAARTNPGALVVVTGCYAQTSPGEVAALPEVDLVVGLGDRGHLVDLVESAVKGPGSEVLVRDISGAREFEELPPPVEQGRVRAFLKIQEGCDSYCAYCIVPHARGPLRSRPPAGVLAEARFLLGRGYREIVLTGIHTGAYGRDLPGDPGLAGLVEQLLTLPGLLRLRLSSVEPNDITPELIYILSGSKVACPHLHIPLQSGDDTVLRRMGRNYTAGEFARLAQVIRASIPGIAITGDVIVGFPGETREQFANTRRLVNKVAFAGLHVFKYSPRRGTPAAGWPDQVDPAEKEERSRELINIGRELARSYVSRHVGRQLEVLVEQPARERKGWLEGHTGNYLRVIFPGDISLRNTLVNVLAGRQVDERLEGRII
ncbi:MAG: tRNA (N(6)-L-threonylcarbamoyladenosine(37)-C(2))-methylthiotransferase MtaB [Bacillota bacterium]